MTTCFVKIVRNYRTNNRYNYAIIRFSTVDRARHFLAHPSATTILWRTNIESKSGERLFRVFPIRFFTLRAFDERK